MLKEKPHYGWLICFCGLLLMFCNSGLVVNSFQVYMPYISEVNGFTELQLSLIPTLRNYQVSYTIGGLLFSSIPGMLADWTGSYYPTRLLAVALAIIVLIGVLDAYRSIRTKN